MKPMLACDIDPKKVIFPIIAQPKIDGVRAIDLGNGLTGRSLRKFNNLRLREINLPGVDGELIVGHDPTSPSLCRDTTSAVNSIHREEYFTLFIFDYVTESTWNKTYRDRMLALMESKIFENEFKFLKLYIIPAKTIETLEDLIEYENRILAEGYEGIIIRQPNSVYKFGRVNESGQNCCRIKRFLDSEAKVLAVVEGKRNTNIPTTNALGLVERSTHACGLEPNGMVGSLICRDIHSGKQITVSPGRMPHSTRKFFWDHQEEIVGKIVKYKFFGYGIKDLPRSPTFQNFRAEVDIDVTEKSYG